MKNKKILFLATAVVLVALFAFGAHFYKSYETKRLSFLASENAELFIRDYSPVLGDEKAKVYLIEFLDPECESCRAFYPAVKQLLKKYEGQLKLVVRYAPFHGNSKEAVKVLEAARKQGKYWEALETLFQYQSQWGSHHNPRPELMYGYLPGLGIDMEKLRADMNDPKIEEMIEQDVKDLKALGVRATPTFFVNGKPLEQFGLDYLKSAIEKEISNAY